MSESLIIAIINLVSKVGIDAAIAFLERPIVTVDDAIAALKRAKEKSLQNYIDEEAARRLLAVTPPPENPA